MAKFPKRESEMLLLGQSISSGLAANAALYPAPPVSASALADLREAFLAAKSAARAAQSAAAQATAAKNEALRAFVDGIKTDLRYAENTVRRDDAKLQRLGWGAPAVPTRASALAVPGQPGMLEAPRQGEGWLFLDWKAPVDGGAVASYRIQRRLLPDGVWTDTGMSVGCGTTLSGQERGREWEYRVSAVNKAGEGAPSNTIMAVL